MLRLVRLVGSVFVFTLLTHAQEFAVLTGFVTDPSAAVLLNAKVKVTDKLRNISHSAKTDANGFFIFDALHPGEYKVEASAEAMAPLLIESVLLKSRDRQELRLVMQLATNKNSVTVEGQTEGISGDASVDAVLEQDFLRHLPVNGRRVDALLQMAPGIVMGNGSNINVNGLRSNTNYYMLDGVSLSSGVPIGGPGGGGPGGPGGPIGVPGGGGGGSATDAISLDAVQEVRIQTSAFAPEFGRTPGAQVSLNSRGGTNTIHGSLFEYFRNDRMNANDWFANQNGFARGRMLQNQFGATVGGPVIRNRTFFFASVERLNLRVPQTTISAVPDLQARNGAAARLRPFLRAYPVPNGAKLDGGAAQFTAVVTNPQDRDSASLRIDHTINSKHAAFVRYNYSPNESQFRGSGFITPNVITGSQNKSHIATASLVSQLNPYSTNEVRGNYSANNMRSQSSMDNFGGAIPLTEDLIFPAGVTSATGQFNLMVLGLSGYNYAQKGRTEQRQFNIIDNLTMNASNHQYKMGVDFRRANNTNYNTPYSLSSTFNGLSGNADSLLSGKSTNTSVSSSVAAVYPQVSNFSYYLQDTWRVDGATTLSFGVRWDVNPAPGVSQGERPYSISTEDSSRISQRNALYNTRWTDFAPRFGMTTMLQNTPGKEVILRGGIGLFHDLGYGTSMSAFSGVPYANFRTLSLGDFPLSNADKAAPLLPAVKPFNRIGAANRDLQSPKVMQWNVTIERLMGTGQSLSVGYAGTRGTRLLRTEQQVSLSDDYDFLTLATNGADSDYHALQAQYRRRFAKNLQAQVSYTWSHSIDTASMDAGFGSGFATLFTSERGNSDYDLRHNLNVSGSYLLPSPKAKVLQWAFGNWYSDFLFAARTGSPFDITGVSSETSNQSSSTSPFRRGLFAQVRPNYNGQPVWIDDPGAPAGIRLNRAAFESPSGFGQGNLGRNSIRGYALSQLDLSIRRQVAITERFVLHLSLQGFNILNHPNFANPQRNEGASMTSANFGVSTQSRNQGFGGGLGSIYQTGGPRSMQIGLRLQF